MLLDLFNDVLSLDLPLEAAESILNRFALLYSHFSHALHTPNLFKDIVHNYRVRA